jgi:hypothetical protein
MMPEIHAFAAGFLLLGFILGILAYPRFLAWARRHLNEFHGGKCSHCGLEAYVTPCKRCGKDVAFCHYYAVLGTDVPNRESLRKRRSSSICVGCLSPAEKDQLESFLKK